MIINLKSPTDMSAFYIIWEGSTLLEEEHERGLSHLMEHLIGKNLDDLQDEMEVDGIEHNLWTSNNEICAYIIGLDEKIEKWKYKMVDLLCDFSNITKEDFEKERNIVLSEYYNSFGDQVSSHWLNLDRKLFNKYNPIGCRKALENLKFMNCLNFFEKQYMYPSKIINVSKNSDFLNDDIIFKSYESDSKLKYLTDESHNPLFEFTNDFNREASLIMLSPIIEEDNAVINFINTLLSKGLNSPLYKEVREKRGLVYYISASQTRYNKSGITSISTLTKKENINEVIEAVKYVFENIGQFLTEERFNIIKESYINNFKINELERYNYVTRWINPDSFSVYEIIDTITFDEVMEVFNKYYNLDEWYISIDLEEFKENK